MYIIGTVALQHLCKPHRLRMQTKQSRTGIRFKIHRNVLVFVMSDSSAFSVTKRPGRLIIAGALGLDPLAVVIVHHLVWDFG